MGKISFKDYFLQSIKSQTWTLELDLNFFFVLLTKASLYFSFANFFSSANFFIFVNFCNNLHCGKIEKIIKVDQLKMISSANRNLENVHILVKKNRVR